MQGVTLITSQRELRTAAGYVAKHNIIAVDTETTGLDPHTSRVRLLQLGTCDQTYIVDCFKVENIEPIHAVLESKYIRKIIHNGKFDSKMLRHHFGVTPAHLFDTMLASRLLSLGVHGLHHDLASVAQRYLNETVSKEQQASDWSTVELSRAQLKYAADDVRVLLRLYPVLRHALYDSGMMPVAELEFAAINPTAHLELNGIHINTVAWRQEINKAKEQLDMIQEELDRELGDKIANSPIKLKQALVSLGLQNIQSTSADTLKEIAAAHPVIPKLLEWRKLEKLTTSYGESMIALISPATGRLHAQFNQMGAVSGRYSCVKPNLQQIPREDAWRGCFKAKPGFTFIISDYSQIELRVLAALAQDERLLKVYAKGLDLHRFTAAMVSGKTMEVVSDEERRLAKAINFGITFGMGANGLSKYARTSYNVDLSPRQAQGHLNLFFEVFPGVRRWQFKASSSAREAGYILTAMGRRIALPKTGAWTRSLNYPVQGTAAEGLKHALILLHQALPSVNGKLVCIVHDEIVIEVPQDREQEAKAVLQTAMIDGMRHVLGDVPVEVDMRSGPTWAKHRDEQPCPAPWEQPCGDRDPDRETTETISANCPSNFGGVYEE